jgi:hypothetical protein
VRKGARAAAMREVYSRNKFADPEGNRIDVDQKV